MSHSAEVIIWLQMDGAARKSWFFLHLRVLLFLLFPSLFVAGGNEAALYCVGVTPENTGVQE